jgi:hypothetical protein
MKTKIMGAGLALWLAGLLAAGLAQGQSVPQLINYQGRLTNAAGQPLDGATVKLTFTFAGAASGGVTYLTITQNNVAVSKGIYNVLIGSGTIASGTETTLAGVFQNHTDVWMGVAVNADAEMTPRQRVATTAYAFRAGVAGQAANLDAVTLWEEQPTGTKGGTFTSGTWVTRTLNRIYPATLPWISLSANQFTLQPGTYLIEASAPAIQVNSHQLRLYNITDAAVEAQGTAEYANRDYFMQTRSSVTAVVTLAVVKTFSLEHRCLTTQGENGLGNAASFGSSEIYTQVKILKYR